jgi:hypothetical protein
VKRDWKERVGLHHIDGNRYNNEVANLRLVHAKTGQPLTFAEQVEYWRHLSEVELIKA